MNKCKPRPPDQSPAEALLGADTVEEFAVRTRISVPMLYRLWKRGEGPPSFFIGRSRRIPRQAGQAWLDELCNKPPPTRLRIFKGRTA